jgi:hypothetical protein
VNGGTSQVTASYPAEQLAKTESPKQAVLAAEIRRIRHQLAEPDTISNPWVNNELLELYKLVWAGQEQRAGRHRLRSQTRDVYETVQDAPGFGDLKPNPLTARTSGELVARLREYREWSGEPPFRKMAERACQKIAHSTMFVALNNDELPRLKVTIAIIEGCGGGEDDQRAFATAWRRIKSGKMNTGEASRSPAPHALSPLPETYT